MRKLTASLLIAAVLWGSLIAPARAFVPLLFPYAAGSVVTTEGTIALSAVLSTVTIGGAIALLTMTDNNSAPAANGSNAAIQIQLDPYTPLVTPESAQASPVVDQVTTETVVSDAQVSYILSNGGSGTASGFGSSTFSSPSALQSAVISYVISHNPSISPVSPGAVGSSSFQYFWSDGTSEWQSIYSVGQCATGSTWNGSDCVQTTQSCPSGYTLNTSDNRCYVNNPDEQQVADAKNQIQRILDKFQKNPNDPDPLRQGVTVTDTKVTVQTPQSTVTAEISPDQSVTLKEVTATPDGNTKVDKVKLSPPTPGQAPEVIGKDSKIVPGQKSGDPGGTGVNSPIEPTDDAGNATEPAAATTVLNLPDNLAKTEKQCGYDAEHPCQTKIDEADTPEDFQTNHGDDLDGQFDELQTFINEQENGVGAGIENPFIGKFASGGCVDPTFSASDIYAGASASIPICSHKSDIDPWTSLAAYVFSAIAIYGIWFRRLGGAS